MPSNYPSLIKWIAAHLLGIAVATGTIFYGLLHKVLGVPISSLQEPYLLFAAFFLALAPVFYWARKHEVVSEGDDRPLLATLAVLFVFGGLFAVHYAHKLGFIPDDTITLRALYAVVVVSLALGVVAMVYVQRKFIRRR